MTESTECHEPNCECNDPHIIWFYCNHCKNSKVGQVHYEIWNNDYSKELKTELLK